MRGRTEVAVIGGGLAGLMAARVLAEQGVDVELLEAKPHVGGRVLTMHPDAELPAELGPEFVHGEPDITLSLLREIRAERETVEETHHYRRGGKLVEEPDLWPRFAKLLKKAPPASHDESARDYMQRVRMSSDEARLFAMLVEGFYASHLERISIASVAADVPEGGTGQARLIGGYGQLPEWLLARILRKHGSVHCGHVVHAIDWSSNIQIAFTGPGGRQGMLVADRVIVTLPLAVLQQNAVSFHPQLGDHERAMRHLEMGHVVKVVACFNRRAWPEQLRFVHSDGGKFPTFWMRSRGDHHQLTAWAGGPHAEALSRRTAGQLTTLAVTELARAIDASATTIAGAVDHFHFHDYAADPYARGAYSYTKVGGAGAAEQLARPLGDRLFFAGEATDAEYEGSVAGALASGVRAAQQILATRSATRAA
ncbi:MAG TPA: NAD(P)/FAD-dependent oxidoreductase [Kofleriaceae bacterium]|nr:NAD(P)/FAD-dependent oxidoreductase [Kofleriaceae bacterium]